MSDPKAIRLIYRDENGKFKMDQEAVSFLQQIKGPIGVVSVCGPGGIGKSYILNLLRGSSSGFKVRSSIHPFDPCTKGLWVWSSPIRRTADDGTEYSLLLMDSGGILVQAEIYFYLAVHLHLSSMLIYNEMGHIDNNALSRLSLVTKLADEHTRVRDSASQQIEQSSPIFVWLLRDFCFAMLDEDDKEITSTDYLELNLKPDPTAYSPLFNKIRESIRALFPNRDCFTLVRPMTEEKELLQLDQISMDKLRPEFKSGLEKFTRFVFERTKPKYVQGTVVTGPIFVGIIESFLDAYNNG